jgi:hypothetical protein
MQRLVLPLDFSSTVPPQADYIDELCVVRKQAAKTLHIVTIPVIDKGRSDRLDGRGFGGSILSRQSRGHCRVHGCNECHSSCHDQIPHRAISLGRLLTSWPSDLGRR